MYSEINDTEGNDMDIQLIFATIGATVTVFFALVLLSDLAARLHCEAARIYGVDGPAGWIVRLFGFGVVYARPGTNLNANCNCVRKTEGRKWFITAPEWFNRNVANIGGVKK